MGRSRSFSKCFSNRANEPILIVSPNLLQAQRTYEDLVKMLGDSLVHLYPAEELIAADFSVSSYELRAQRIDTLDHMVRIGKGIYITPIAGMKKLLPEKERWLSNSLSTKIGAEINMEEWLERLVSMGYTRQSMVTAPGEFALRGGILDLYPLNLEEPVRIELFDTDVDSIRTFSAEDQRSTGKLKDVSILPAAEFVWKAEDLMIIAEKLEHALGVSLKKMNDEEAKERLTINMTGRYCFDEGRIHSGKYVEICIVFSWNDFP